MASWIHIEQKIIPRAIGEYRRLTLDGAREKFKFHPANAVHMYYGGVGPFESRVFVAVAYSIQHPDKSRLIPKSFEGSDAKLYLESIGFEARPIVRAVKPPKPAAKAHLRRVA